MGSRRQHSPQQEGARGYGAHTSEGHCALRTGADAAEQPDSPTACIISVPQPVIEVVLHPGSNTIFTTGWGRRIGVLAPATRIVATYQAQAEAARIAAEQARQQEAARQHERQQELRVDDIPMASEDGPGRFHSQRVDVINSEP
jgi:hypothetical protein